MASLPTTGEARSTYLAPDYHASAGPAAERMRKEAAARADALVRMGVGSVFEVGCGPGHFLDACRDRAIWAEGIDPAATAREASERGHKVHPIFVEQFEPSRRVDALAMWDVVEHLPQPLDVLRHARTWLRRGGRILISTPSMSGIPARVLGRRFPMITPPDHLALFSRSGLKRLLERAGFLPEKIRSFSGLGQTELRRGYQRYVVGESPAAAIAAGVLARATALPMWFADRVGLGTTFEVIARAA